MRTEKLALSRIPVDRLLHRVIRKLIDRSRGRNKADHDEQLARWTDSRRGDSARAGVSVYREWPWSLLDVC